MTTKGLRIYVSRTAAWGDCTNGGVSGSHDALTLIGTVEDFDVAVTPLERDYHSPFEPSEDAPAVALHIRTIGEKIPSIVPVTFNDRTEKWERALSPMAGGNYAHGDSRLSDLIRASTGHGFYGAVAIHDRTE